jgi:hypothetical protein
MCLGAAIHARIDRVVFGAADPRVGAVSQVLSIQEGTRSPNHRLAITGGVEAEASAALLREFFAARRRQTEGGRPDDPPAGAPAPERSDRGDRLEDPSGFPNEPSLDCAKSDPLSERAEPC